MRKLLLSAGIGLVSGVLCFFLSVAFLSILLLLIGAVTHHRPDMTRAAYAHDAVVILDSGGDSRAPGGAITVALCGHWDHQPPCPLAPHHTDATPAGDDTVRLRVLFAAEPHDEPRVRALIGKALSSGRLTGPDGRVTRWMVKSSSAGSIRADEVDHAARLAAS